MKNQNFPNLEERIKDIVSDAVESMNFKQINQDLQETINGALEEVRSQVKHGMKQPETSVKQTPPVYVKPDLPVYIKTTTNGRTAGILYTVFGGIGMGFSGVGILLTGVSFITSSFGLVARISTLTFWAAMFMVFSAMLWYGCSINGRMSRLKRYIKLMRGKTYCSIKELSAFMGMTERQVLNDMRKLIKKGNFSEGHLDKQGTCLMLDDSTYNQYLQAQDALERRLLQEKLNKKRKIKTEPIQPEEEFFHMPVNEPKETDPLTAVIEEGNSYIRRLREINDAIPGEIISAKLYRLETITGRIFAAIKKQPQQVRQIRKFMDYYLPTTLKLVTAYQEFDSVETAGDNITSAKEEIEKTLDTINSAFEKLLDDLYQDAAFDASTDASVLQAMLAKEGLTESDFKEEG